MQKEKAATEDEMRKLRDDVKQKEERILFCRIRSRNKDGRCRHGSRTSRVVGRRRKKGQQCLRRQEIAAWRSYGSKLLPCVLQWDQTRSMLWPMLSSVGSRKMEQFRSRNSEDEQEQGRARASGIAHARRVHSRCTGE